MGTSVPAACARRMCGDEPVEVVVLQHCCDGGGVAQHGQEQVGGGEVVGVGGDGFGFGGELGDGLGAVLLDPDGLVRGGLPLRCST